MVDLNKSKDKKASSGNFSLHFTGTDLLIFLEALRAWLDEYAKKHDVEITSYHAGIDYNKTKT